MYVILMKEHEGITDIEKVKVDEEVLTLQIIRDLVGCDWLETLTVKDDVLLVFDEEYLLTHENPVVNYLPSCLVGRPLCGNVLICRLVESEMVSVSEENADVMVEQLEALQQKMFDKGVVI